MELSLERLQRNATECRDLASTAMTPAAKEILSGLAQQYEEEAVTLQHSDKRRARRPVFSWWLS